MPRLIRPNATYAIERRIERRRFLLRPDAELNNLFIWLVAICAERTGVEVHIATVMSTHFHLVVHAPHENVSVFMHLLDMHMACALQVYRRFAHGVIWEPGKLSIVELVTPEAVEQQIAYAIVNPVKAGLVYEPEDWPGVTASVQDLDRRVFGGRRPAFYFGADKWPEETAITFTLPAWLSVFGDEEEVRRRLEAEVLRQKEEARADVKEKGWKVMGAIAAANVSPYRRAKSWEELGTLRPHIAAGRGQREAREAAIARLRCFRGRHAECKARWCAGERDVVFPAGTYWMRVHHGVAVEPFE